MKNAFDSMDLNEENKEIILEQIVSSRLVIARLLSELGIMDGTYSEKASTKTEIEAIAEVKHLELLQIQYLRRIDMDEIIKQQLLSHLINNLQD